MDVQGYILFGFTLNNHLGIYDLAAHLYKVINENCFSGNILVLITIFRFMNTKSVTNLFIVNLSFGDILVIGLALPFRVSDI